MIITLKILSYGTKKHYSQQVYWKKNSDIE